MAHVSYGSPFTNVDIGILRRVDAGNRCLNALLRSFIHLTSYKLIKILVFIVNLIIIYLQENLD